MNSNQQVSAATDVVARAHALMSRGWARGSYAEDDRGNHVDTLGPEASCFCASGALYRAASELGCFPGDTYEHARKLILDRINMTPLGKFNSLPVWNDTVGKDTVVDTFAAVIKCAGRKVEA